MAQVRILNFMKHRGLRQDAQRSGFVVNDEKSQWVPVQSGVAGLCFESTDGDIAGSAKEGGCFSSCSAGCSSYCFFFCLEGSTLYSAPGFYKFGAGSSSTPVGTEFIS